MVTGTQTDMRLSSRFFIMSVEGFFQYANRCLIFSCHGTIQILNSFISLVCGPVILPQPESDKPMVDSVNRTCQCKRISSLHYQSKQNPFGPKVKIAITIIWMDYHSILILVYFTPSIGYRILPLPRNPNGGFVKLRSPKDKGTAAPAREVMGVGVVLGCSSIYLVSF